MMISCDTGADRHLRSARLVGKVLIATYLFLLLTLMVSNNKTDSYLFE